MLCPDSTLFNKTTQSCTGCGTGYHGPNCLLACRYPNYGRECQEECYCKEKNCNHVTGWFYNDTTSSKDDPRSVEQPMAISISLVIGVLLVIAAFILIMKAKKRFFASITRGNARYVGSLVAEQCVSMHNYAQTQLHVEDNAIPDNDIYMLARSIKR
ncbi:uncharacterized protein LOC144619539 isoform X2 [Crassostrea virginica]